MAQFDANKIMSGTFGSAWLDGEKLSEIFALEAKLEITKEAVSVCGEMAEFSKFVGYKGTGTLKMRKVNSRMASKLSDSLKTGVNPSVEILSELADPAATGAERVLLKGVQFDDLTMANWEVKKPGEVEVPFTFTDWEFYDLV